MATIVIYDQIAPFFEICKNLLLSLKFYVYYFCGYIYFQFL